MTIPGLLASKIASSGTTISAEAVRQMIANTCRRSDYVGKKLLLIVPDSTRTAPVGMVFKEFFAQLGGTVAGIDIMIALGTHPPMSEEAICRRLEISPEERVMTYRDVRFFNHAWDDPATLATVGTIPASDIEELSGGLFSLDVEVRINRRVFDYDQLVIIGPVFPHEVVGCSGGNKYLFPGIGGPEILNFFHWLGAVVTNARIIGHALTPVRRVVDRAGAMVPVDKLCFCLVVDQKRFAGCFVGTPEAAWSEASKLSRERHILYKDKPFHTILSCAPAMYDELWVGGKCMYKLEPVLADGGELIIYAPHLHEISITHGRLIEEIGYHCRDYFLKQWDRFKDYPWGVLAHSTHVYGIGTYENGTEIPRARVTLATGIPEETCRRINFGYRDPATINPQDYANREQEGVLLVPQAGEILYQLVNPPEWATNRQADAPLS